MYLRRQLGIEDWTETYRWQRPGNNTRPQVLCESAVAVNAPQRGGADAPVDAFGLQLAVNQARITLSHHKVPLELLLMPWKFAWAWLATTALPSGTKPGNGCFAQAGTSQLG